MTFEELLGATHAGSVCDVDEVLGRGFVRNQRIHDLTGRDVRFRLGQFASATSVGDVITFWVELDAKGVPWLLPPNACSSTPGVRSEGAPSAPCKLSEQSDCRSLFLEELTGVIVHFFEGAGYGFIRNDEVQRCFGKDVRFQAWQFLGRSVGDIVTFRLRVSDDGLPRVAAGGGRSVLDSQQARQVRDGDTSGGMVGSGADIGMVQHGEVLDINHTHGFAIVKTGRVEIFVPQRFLNGLAVGDHVEVLVDFGVETGAPLRSSVRPRALDLKRLSNFQNSPVVRSSGPQGSSMSAGFERSTSPKSYGGWTPQKSAPRSPIDPRGMSVGNSLHGDSPSQPQQFARRGSDKGHDQHQHEEHQHRPHQHLQQPLLREQKQLQSQHQQYHHWQRHQHGLPKPSSHIGSRSASAVRPLRREVSSTPDHSTGWALKQSAWHQPSDGQRNVQHATASAVSSVERTSTAWLPRQSSRRSSTHLQSSSVGRHPRRESRSPHETVRWTPPGVAAKSAPRYGLVSGWACNSSQWHHDGEVARSERWEWGGNGCDADWVRYQ